MTRAQRAVLSVLQDEPTFISAQDIHARLRALGERVGLTSVYRALQALTESDAVDSLRTDAGEVTYRLCATARHHHHLVCRTCGATVEIEAGSLEQWVTRVARAHGYSVDGHTLEISGRCADCTRRDRAGPVGA